MYETCFDYHSQLSMGRSNIYAMLIISMHGRENTCTDILDFIGKWSLISVQYPFHAYRMAASERS